MKKTLTTDIILKCFGAIPRKMRIGFFTGLFRLYYHLSSKHRLIAIHNLKCAFPEKKMEEIIAITKGVYRTMGIVAADFFGLPSLTKDNINDLVEVEGLEHCQKAFEQNRGILMVTAHFGNWELAAIAFSLVLKPAVVIYRPLDSAILDNLVYTVRSSTGNTPLPKNRAMRQMIRSLKRNEVLGILIDQNVFQREGVFVDFFGRPACTNNGLALIAMHTEAPVIPAYLVRLENGKYRLVIKEEIKLIRTGDNDEDIRINTQNFTRFVEDVVRKYPDQWLWVHQRWKTKPLADTKTVRETGL
jgi:KDO2-lipid IV(A) lauroyltransferase